MTQDLFSVTIFFVVFREGLEASLIVFVLLSLVEQILHKDPNLSNNSTVTDPESNPTTVDPRILRKLRLQVCTRLLHLHLPSTYFPGRFRGAGRSSRCSCHRWSLHRRLVHTSKEPLVKRGTIMGRHAFPPYQSCPS